MTTSEVLTQYVQTIIDALVVQKVTQVVISPGSRSTPVALLVAHNADRYGLRLFVDVDERSAGFFALGLTKATHRPTLLVCTSGTAAANYYPAIIEAQQAQHPLLILTTDRPPELTKIGAPQAIDQNQLYGNHVKSFNELPLPTANADVLKYVVFNVQRQVQFSQTQPKGPIHFNLPLRKPLMPVLSEVNGQPTVASLKLQTGTTRLDEGQLNELCDELTGKKVLVVAGQDDSALEPTAVLKAAEKFGWPIWADVLSQLRGQASDLLFTGYDALLSSSQHFGLGQPEVVIQVGKTPVSAAVSAWVKDFDGPVYTVDLAGQLNDGTKATTTHIQVLESTFFEQLLEKPVRPAKQSYTKTWKELAQNYQILVKEMLATTDLQEAQVPYFLGQTLTNANIFISNSMPIRDFNQFYFAKENGNRLYCNRGANGIDGIVSTGMGMAAAGVTLNYLVVGDLAFFHDMGGLMMAKRYQLDITIVVLNNNGGGIFSFLPQAEAPQYFEMLFGTPQDLDLASVAQLYGAVYEQVKSPTDLQAALAKEVTGLRIVEVQTNRHENVLTHRTFNTQAHQEMRKVLDHPS